MAKWSEPSASATLALAWVALTLTACSGNAYSPSSNGGARGAPDAGGTSGGAGDPASEAGAATAGPAGGGGIGAAGGAAGTGQSGSAGAGGGTTACQPVSSDRITDFSDAISNRSGIGFGTPPNPTGGTYSYAAPGLSAPALRLVSVGAGRALSVSVHPGPASDFANSYLGFGLGFGACIDATAYNGVEFTLAGNVGDCSLQFGANFSEAHSASIDSKGSCTADSCYPPTAPVTQSGTIRVAFADQSGGSPVHVVDAAKVIGIEWQMTSPPNGLGCSADFTLSDLHFLNIPPPPAVCVGSPPLGASITDAANGLVASVFNYAAPGLSAPTVSLTPAGKGTTEQLINVGASPGTPTEPANASLGVGLALAGCVDASAYSGVEFTIVGGLGSCSLQFQASTSEDTSHDANPSGACTGPSCTPAGSGPIGIGTSTVFFSDLVGGSPVSSPETAFDSAALTGIQWTLTEPSEPGCLADFTISNVRLLPAEPTNVAISIASKTPRTSTWSVNYWLWPPSYGDDVSGTESLLSPLTPTLLRAGGYANDTNFPDPFDNAAVDRFVAYARAIGAEPLIQVPLLADTAGLPPSAAEAAAMVEYANVSKGYGVKYFSIGNEPDLYPDQGSLSNASAPAIPGYTPEDYCASARAYVTQMKLADPTIRIIGPDLGYKYQFFNDWLTPILTECGDLFDVVAIHRYPFEAQQATLFNAAADAESLVSTVTSVRGLLQGAGYGDKPLAITEMNIVYDTTQSPLAASPETVPAALWLADSIGTGIQLGLWTTAVWSISDSGPFGIGLLGAAPGHTPRPAYYALKLFADHLGPTLVAATAINPELKVYASRNKADDATQAILVNWNQSPQAVTVDVTRLAQARASVALTVGALSLAALEIPDLGAARAWSYGQREFSAGKGPAEVPLMP